MSDFAGRIASLNRRADEAISKAKSGRSRIKGDGDGDGIPYEGRGKKGGAGGGAGKANPFAQRHLGVTNAQYTREDGSRVSYQIAPGTIARNLPKWGRPIALASDSTRVVRPVALRGLQAWPRIAPGSERTTRLGLKEQLG